MNSKITAKDWMKFIIFTLFIFIIGAMVGVSVGRNYPNSSVKQEWMNEFNAEVDNLIECQRMADEEYRVNTALRDSIIGTLKRELDKGVGTEVPIIVKINIKE